MDLKLFLIFISVVVLDGLVFPSLFAFNTSLLALTVPVVVLIFFNLSNRSLFISLFFIAATENFRGLSFGSFLVPFVLTIVFFVFVRFFLDIRYSDRRFGFVNIGLASVVSVILLYVFIFFAGFAKIEVSYINSLFFSIIILESFFIFFLMEFLRLNNSTNILR